MWFPFQCMSSKPLFLFEYFLQYFHLWKKKTPMQYFNQIFNTHHCSLAGLLPAVQPGARPGAQPSSLFFAQVALSLSVCSPRVPRSEVSVVWLLTPADGREGLCFLPDPAPHRPFCYRKPHNPLTSHLRFCVLGLHRPQQTTAPLYSIGGVPCIGP